MAGVSSYKTKEIRFVLKSIVRKTKQTIIMDEFKSRFEKTLNANQIRYIKNKYGKDPKSPLVNFKGNHAKDMKYFRPGKRTEDLDEEDEEGSDSENDRPSASLGVSSTVTPGRTCVHATGSSQNLASDVQQLVIPSTAEAHQNYEQLRPEWNGNGNEGVGYAQGNIPNPYLPVEGNVERVQSNAIGPSPDNVGGFCYASPMLSVPHVGNNFSQPGFDSQSAFGSNYQQCSNPMLSSSFGQMNSQGNLYNVQEHTSPKGNLSNLYSLQVTQQQFHTGNGGMVQSGQNGFNSAGLPAFVSPHGQTRVAGTPAQKPSTNLHQVNRYAPYPSPAQNSRDSAGPGWSPSCQYEGPVARFNRRSSKVKIGSPLSKVTGLEGDHNSNGGPGQRQQMPSQELVPASYGQPTQGFPGRSSQGQVQTKYQPTPKAPLTELSQRPIAQLFPEPLPASSVPLEQQGTQCGARPSDANGMGDTLTPCPPADLNSFVFPGDTQFAVPSNAPINDVPHYTQEVEPLHAGGSDDSAQPSWADPSGNHNENATATRDHENRRLQTENDGSPLAVDPSLQIEHENQQATNDSLARKTDTNEPIATNDAIGERQEKEASLGDNNVTDGPSEFLPPDFTASEEFLSMPENICEFDNQFSLLADDTLQNSFGMAGHNDSSPMFPNFNFSSDQTVNPDDLSRF